MATPTTPSIETVEAAVRAQLAKALGGRRGMLEAAVPTLLFTLIWLPTKEIKLALVISAASALVLLVVRLVQRTTTQFVLNALFGIGVGWFFVHLSASSGGSADDQALAYFLPGIITSGGLSVITVISCLTRWPLVGFMVGSVAGDPTAWHDNPQIVKLCVQLTWLLMLPGLVGVLLQGPVWLLGHQGTLEADTAVTILTGLRIGLGWPLRVASWSALVWLLGRNHTPIDPAYDVDLGPADGRTAEA
ncbi:hypothetical protein ABIE44_000174 [Marmoricola sp. OAE513]|uniref:DUF3159 domain-containing protein n=1 Tax=Marmoricola sp. OAE513 TaxID=2817894 RepID=UPI001AE5835B